MIPYNLCLIWMKGMPDLTLFLNPVHGMHFQ